MLNKILDALEPQKDSVSYFDRMKGVAEFLTRHGLSDLLLNPMRDEPMSFILAATTGLSEIFEYQLNSMAQFDHIFNCEDDMIVACSLNLAETARTTIQSMQDRLPKTTLISVENGQTDHGPGLHWAIGTGFAANRRLFFFRDASLFFHPWNLVRLSRDVNIEGNLVNFATVYGCPLTPASDKWYYLVHSRFAPTPFLSAWVCGLHWYNDIGGFNLMFNKASDQASCIDFLTRWSKRGYVYQICDETELLYVASPSHDKSACEVRLPEVEIRNEVSLDQFQSKGFRAPLNPAVPLTTKPLTEHGERTVPGQAGVQADARSAKAALDTVADSAREKVHLDKFIVDIAIL